MAYQSSNSVTRTSSHLLMFCFVFPLNMKKFLRLGLNLGKSSLHFILFKNWIWLLPKLSKKLPNVWFSRSFFDVKKFDWQSSWIYLTIVHILLPKLLWPILRKKCSTDWEKPLKFQVEGWVFANILRSLNRTIYWNSDRSEQFW